MSDNRIMRQVKGYHGIGPSGNYVNGMIGLYSIGQDDYRGKTADADPLERSLLMGCGMASCLNYD